MKNAIILTALALFLGACNLPSTPAQAPLSTETSTAAPQASSTVAPSPTTQLPVAATATTVTLLEPTVQLIPTFVFNLASPTPPASKDLDCRLVSQSVANESHFKPRERFSMGWNITNIGRTTWYPGGVVFAYIAGTKLGDVFVVQLKSSVDTGKSVNLTVDMRAPRNESKYTTIWSLRRGEEYFCRVKVTINVP